MAFPGDGRVVQAIRPRSRHVGDAALAADEIVRAGPPHNGLDSGDNYANMVGVGRVEKAAPKKERK